MTATSAPIVTRVRAELRDDSTDVADSRPRLSWTTASATPNWEQFSAEIELDGDSAVSRVGRQSVLVPWPFEPIAVRARHSIRVRVTGIDGVLSDWSEPHEIVSGFLGDDDWVADMIGLASPSRIAQPALLRTGFAVDRPVARATLYGTARGAYQVLINGKVVDDQILKPGWTPYRSRLVHESTDVTSLLQEGANALGAQLTGGWYTERYGFRPTSQPFYGDQPAVSLQLVIEYKDGTEATIATGADWRATGDGPFVDAGIYDGETYDARQEIDGWAEPEFPDAEWSSVRVDGPATPVPTARTSPAVRAIEEVAVVEVLQSESGEQIFDFGQNLVGRLRITVSGEAGTVVTLRHAEVIEHGELGVRPLRLAKATDRYILRGTGEETWEPTFTFHGFRYAQVLGLAGALDKAAVTAVVIHSDMRRTGTFDSSHELLNRLHENVVWGMRGNFLYLPTDCPQRDERFGWTGDIQVFAPTASFIYDTDAFLSSWLTDLALEQDAAGGGVVPFIIPSVLPDSDTPSAAWGDAATVVPSVLYERFGDVGVLQKQFSSMQKWADCLLDLAGERFLWEGGQQFGDWLDPTAPPENAHLAKTSPDIVASAYLYRSVDLTARAAETLGLDAVATKYAAIAEKVRAAFLAEYVDPSGIMTSDAQTAYAMAIIFGLSGTDAQRARMGERLAELVQENEYCIGTGFVGTPLIADALTVTGHLDAASRLLTETKNPSWLYPVTMGATTIWERWDSMLEDGTINPGEMTSFNHYALGAVADWMHRTVAGISPAEPGYEVIDIAPRPIDQLTHATATLETPYGPARVAWRREDGHIVTDVEVPANARANVVLPGTSETIRIGSGTYSWTTAHSEDIGGATAVSRA